MKNAKWFRQAPMTPRERADFVSLALRIFVVIVGIVALVNLIVGFRK